RQRSFTIDATALAISGVITDAAIRHRQRSFTIDATAAAGGMAVGNGQIRDGDVRGEDFKNAVSAVTIDRQTSSTGTIDGHVVVYLKFTAGQQDRAGDTCGVNRVAVLREGERVPQRAGSAVIGVCDHDDGSWQ